ncbi:DNA-binding protein [Mesorhizobium sp. M1E.F.Ca.ET.045.02.1.1]|uniref:helix-turn-helix domain-containing protein n=1 Tax=Mesorhizobium sp. M1E.F.Ca.ET.045.02.1.1 TaxID=2493672 RepID=UPI000F758BD1|nr:helix-turn-helix domain-containing protein [Mesorhizobium sp. M1E.F.Ca.ET.045.02.1.1]AZO23843.1 DNA-binding protein [Mesorhizobium sp. M1E.F.Ca.ET.045.02.1.1]
MSAPNAYTVAAFCDAYGIRRNSAYLEIKAGRLEIRKAGRKTLIRKVDADAWLNSLPKGNPEPASAEEA